MDEYVPALYTLQKTQKRKKYLDGFIHIAANTLRVYDEKRHLVDVYNLTSHTSMEDDTLELSKCILQIEDEHRELLTKVKAGGSATASTAVKKMSVQKEIASVPQPKEALTETRTAPVAKERPEKKAKKREKRDQTVAQPPLVASESAIKEQPTEAADVADTDLAECTKTLIDTLSEESTRYIHDFLTAINALVQCNGKVTFVPRKELISMLIKKPITVSSLSKYTATQSPTEVIVYASLVHSWIECLLPLLQTLANGGTTTSSTNKSTSYNISLYKDAVVTRRINTSRARRLQIAEAERLVRARKLDASTLKHLKTDTSSSVEREDTWKLSTNESIVYAKADLFVLVPQSSFRNLRDMKGSSGTAYDCYFFTVDSYQPTAAECQAELLLKPLSDTSRWLAKAHISGHNMDKDYDNFGAVQEKVVVFHYEAFQITYTLLDALHDAYMAVANDSEGPPYACWMRDALLSFIWASHGPSWSFLRGARNRFKFDVYFREKLSTGTITMDDAPQSYILRQKIKSVDYLRCIYYQNLNKSQQQSFLDIVRKLSDSSAKPAEGPEPCSPHFYLLRGVFGSGKSRLLTALLLFLLEVLLISKDAEATHIFTPRILVVTNTNVAVDSLLQRLISAATQLGIQHKEPSIDVYLSMFIARIGSGLTTPNLNIFNGQLAALGEKLIIFTTFASLGRLTPLITDCDYFPLVIIDEASQLTEPLLLYALYSLCYQVNLVILAGDHMQLPPVATTASLAVSTFERLITTNEQRSLTKLCMVATLWTQYRCCRPIADLAGYLFYDGRVVTVDSGTSQVIPGLASVASVHLPSSFDKPVRGSRENIIEAKAIAQFISQLVYEYDVSPKDIGVITPFRAQASCIEAMLRKSVYARPSTKVATAVTAATAASDTPHISIIDDDAETVMPAVSTRKLPINPSIETPIFRICTDRHEAATPAVKLSDVIVATVDSFQGSEKAIILVSLTQSANIRFFTESDNAGHINFPNRVNVAITRAINHLIIFQSHQLSGDGLTSQLRKISTETMDQRTGASCWAKIVAYTINIERYFLGLDSLLKSIGETETPQDTPLFSALVVPPVSSTQLPPLLEEHPTEEPRRKVILRQRALSLDDRELMERIALCTPRPPAISEPVLLQAKTVQLLQALGSEW